jgi:uncharacterized membrane protein YkoI
MKKLTGKSKWLMVGLLAVAIGGAGVALTAMAQGEHGKQGSKEQEKAKYRSTIQVPDDSNEREEAGDSEEGENKEENKAAEANEANESQDREDGDEAEDRAEGAESERLKSLARITPEQASAAALAQVPGTVTKVELENEDGNVVYGVEIKTAHGESDVKVDAGDGRVLHVEKDGEDD